MTIRFASLAAICLGLACGPATAQLAPGQVDADAIVNFDPSGAHGVPLTCEVVRAYVTKPVPRPISDVAKQQLSMNRSREAKAAKKAMLSDETIYVPLWEERAFELKDGSIRPMTEFEKATLAELDALEAQSRTDSAQFLLSRANETEQHAYADALCGLLENGFRLAGRDYVGYRKIDDQWRRFEGWSNGADGGTLTPIPVPAEIEVLLLRYELAREAMARGVELRRQWIPNTTPNKPF